MNKKQRNLVLYLAVSLLVGFLLFTLLKVNALQEQLELQQQKELSLTNAMSTQDNLSQIDSMLVDGEDYTAALLAYQAKFQNEGDVNQQLAWRMAVAEKLMRLNVQQAAIASNTEEAEEISVTNTISPDLLQKQDSLRFALEKTKLQLSRIRKQMQQKSFGEYLTFSTAKGNQLHYVGGVKHGMANGFGIAILNSGSRYKGEWRDNLRHGHGTFYWADGQYYEGEYANDKRNGEGTYYWPNGEKYVGNWKNDERWGSGVFYDKDGNTIADGIWKGDKLVEQSKKRKKETETMVTVSL
ncbi:MORN repeat-containing protein [Croceivirga thetidis]|uniref:MORN repeat-containing protein n=1 Tax=Croceivirga thetidis TaxID=2721623 RepID=A0ABX1GQZ1_9FLAO|nr:hypothetical protein [Croceivirga thetidis]NKI32334.1 hypothetical protein [Croceivirga thetidis]